MTGPTEATSAPPVEMDFPLGAEEARHGSGEATGARGQEHLLRMLDLPGRGDTVAWRWMAAGVGAYFMLAAVLALNLHDDRGTLAGLRILLGLGEPLNPTVAVLVVSGIALCAMTVLTLVGDIRSMTAEEADIEWVLLRKRDGLNLVFARASEREMLYASGSRTIPAANAAVETLTDDRVRRVQRALFNDRYAGVSVEELRVIAEQRTARLGSFARFASSLLLLLAVLGTFAGVKTALPGLIDALGAGAASTATGVSGNAVRTTMPSIEQLRAPLQALSGAFGGNALALIGAIAVGLMAQGVSFGRRQMLERLELVSSEFIYGQETASSTDPLQAAVKALNNTANELHSASGTMVGIQEGIQSLGTQFENSLGDLSSKLEEIVRRQEEGLYDKTGATLEALQKRVGQLASVVQENALTYQGLVDSVRERTDESRASIDQMRISNDRLAHGLDALLTVGDRAKETFGRADSTFGAAEEQFRVMESASTRIADSNDETSRQVAAIAGVLGSLETLLRSDGRDEMTKQLASLHDVLSELGPRLERIDKSNESVAQHLERGDARTAELLKISSRSMESKEDALGASLLVSTQRSSPLPTTSAGLQDREIVALLRRIADQNEPVDTAPTFRQQLALQALPVTVSLIAGSGLTLLLVRWFSLR